MVLKVSWVNGLGIFGFLGLEVFMFLVLVGGLEVFIVWMGDMISIFWDVLNRGNGLWFLDLRFFLWRCIVVLLVL